MLPAICLRSRHVEHQASAANYMPQASLRLCSMLCQSGSACESLNMTPTSAGGLEHDTLRLAARPAVAAPGAGC